MRTVTFAALAAALLSLSACMHEKHEADHAQKLAAADVPAQVMNPIKARFPGAQFTSIEKELEHGNTIYDFEMTQNGRKFESDVKDDGTIIEIEKQVEERDLPASVTGAIKAKHPNATIKEAMEVDKVTGQTETPTHYEITLSENGKEREIKLTLDGGPVHEK